MRIRILTLSLLVLGAAPLRAEQAAGLEEPLRLELAQASRQQDRQDPAPPLNNLQAMIDKLAASGSSNGLVMDLDSALLNSAAKSLPNAEDQKLLSGLKAIHIRMFDLAVSGEVAGKLQPVRDQLRSPQWFRSVSFTSGEDDIAIWSSRDGDKPSGVLLISVSGRRIFTMNVIGEFRPDQLLSLSGRLGIPNIESKIDIPLDRLRPRATPPVPPTLVPPLTVVPPQRPVPPVLAVPPPLGAPAAPQSVPAAPRPPSPR